MQEQINFFQQIISWPVWQNEFLGNSAGMYVYSAALLVGLLLIFKIIQYIILSRLNKAAKYTKTELDDVLVDIISSARPPFYTFLALYFAIASLHTPPLLNKAVAAILLIWVIYLVIQSVSKLLNYTVRKRLSLENEDASKNAVAVLGKVVNGVLWAIGGLFILSNLGVNVSSMLAGLGIGGIAIAIAAQNVLGDLFSSFAIYFDKPFVQGDFIVVGQHMGVVERVGIKTTRVRALQGEEIVISNQELTSARIQNFKKMIERRIVFSFGLIYSTPTDQLKTANKIVEDVVGQVDGARLDRTHFQKFDSSSLTFEVVYYVTSPDYNAYMDIQQDINFRIKEGFEKAGLEMAYPTQTIYIAK